MRMKTTKISRLEGFKKEDMDLLEDGHEATNDSLHDFQPHRRLYLEHAETYTHYLFTHTTNKYLTSLFVYLAIAEPRKTTID